MKLATKEKRMPTEEELYKFGAVGCGMASMSSYYDMSTKSFYELLTQYPKLWHALKKGEFESNVTVQSKGYEMAVSGEHPAMTIFWLKTRCGFREEPIFNFIVQKFGVKEPKNLNPEQLEEVYHTACDVLKEKQEMRQLKTDEYAVKRRRKPSKNLDEHLEKLKNEEDRNG